MKTTPPQDPKQIVRVMQIIAVNLMLGVAVFGGFLFLTAEDRQPKPASLAYIAIAGAGIALVIHAVVKWPIDSRRLQSIQVANRSFNPRSEEAVRVLGPIYQTEMIIQLAILEGAAFLNGTAYLLEAQWWNLAAMGLLLGAMVLRFPTRGRIEAWIERRTLHRQFEDVH